MQPSDPFPIERCSPRLRAAVLAEFEGRSPTFQDILSIPTKEWMTVPGMGPRLLQELEGVLKSEPVVASTISDDAELMARIERLQHDLGKVLEEIRVLISQGSLSKSDADVPDRH